MSDIRADLSQFYAMKAAFEQILGRSSFAKVKDYAPLTTWKAEAIRLLKAVSLAIDETVEVADEDWRVEVQAEIGQGIARIKLCSEISALFANLSATLTYIVFLQIGFIPLGHRNRSTIPLKRGNWKLSTVRTVQYVQTEQQRELQSRLRVTRKQRAET